jgi:hypothetical protein
VLDDVAERDEAQPFTDADMLQVLKQIREARGWSVSDQALQVEIQALQNAAPLRDRFQFLKKTIRKLGVPVHAPVTPPLPPGGGNGGGT